MLAWREGSSLNRSLMGLGARSGSSDQVPPSHLRRVASSGTTDVCAGLVAIYYPHQALYVHEGKCEHYNLFGVVCG